MIHRVSLRATPAKPRPVMAWGAVVRTAVAGCIATCCLTAQVVQAADESKAGATAEAQVAVQADAPTAEALDAVQKRLAHSLPNIAVDSLSTTPIDGLYELVTEGQVYYVNATGDMLIDGDMIELSTRANLTEARRGGLHLSMVEAVGEENMLIYEPDEPSDRSITVFTDISCGYCRKLHAEMDTLMDAGIRVRYLMFPRAGLDSPGRQDLESVWCASNPQAAMTTAKAGGRIEPGTCENPIESHVALAERVGLRGTPLIYLDSGERIPGYRDAATIAGMIKGSTPQVH